MPDAIDVTGVWMDKGFPTRIEQVGTQVTATWLAIPYECQPGPGTATVPSTLNFEGLRSGDYISGHTTTCWTSGLKQSSCEMTLSPDGNTLTGHWWSDESGQDEPFTLTRCPDWLERKDLERDDNVRWQTLGLPEVSWYWPASFYTTINTNGTATFEGKHYYLGSSDWITTSGYFQEVQLADMERGDVVVFEGNEAEGQIEGADYVFRNKNTNPKPVSHSGIATGRGDEVSQLWWTREVRKTMKRLEGIVMKPPFAAPSPLEGGYGITRDSIADLVAEFTDKDGDVYLVGSLKVWRPRDQAHPSFDALGGGACDRWPVRHLVRPNRGATWFSP